MICLSHLPTLTGFWPRLPLAFRPSARNLLYQSSLVSLLLLDSLSTCRAVIRILIDPGMISVYFNPGALIYRSCWIHLWARFFASQIDVQPSEKNDQLWDALLQHQCRKSRLRHWCSALCLPGISTTTLLAIKYVMRSSAQNAILETTGPQSTQMCMCPGPNTLIGLGKGKADKAALVKKLVPHYKALFEQLKGQGVPEIQLHEPILVTPGANKYQVRSISSAPPSLPGQCSGTCVFSVAALDCFERI